MIYLDEFKLVSAYDEDIFLFEYNPAKPISMMTCYSDDPYPFNFFPQKNISKFDFSDITMLYGTNGSGKSTVLNIISEKLGIAKNPLFNYTPYYEEYLKMCSYDLDLRAQKVPVNSRLIRSDDVFDFMLDIRAVNVGVDNDRQRMFDEYNIRKNVDGQHHYQLSSLDDYEELKERNYAKHHSKSEYTRRHGLAQNVRTVSNGEAAFDFFSRTIRENALYLLDEPENSLSPKLQIKLAKYIEEAARFYGCQFIIATHSPFLLAMKDVKIYDLDSKEPSTPKKWTELENIREYYGLFRSHEKEF